MSQAFTRPSVVATLLAAMLLLVIGWEIHYFLTDDAYIAFRYILNRRQGYGYTWNAPPFLPVEGYTSFMWVVLLDAIWSMLDIGPERASCALSLIFSCGSLLLGSALVFHSLPSHARSREFSAYLPVYALCLVSNRTFLMWTSSGLETALFNFLVLVWFASLVLHGTYRRRWILMASLAAALLYLTRPDGLLFAAATIGAVALHWLADPPASRASKVQRLGQTLSLLALPAHLAFRYTTYGELLPNTYYAKYSQPWPESGLHYLTSFVLEYGLWLIPLPALVVLGWLAYRSRTDGDPGLQRVLGRLSAIAGETAPRRQAAVLLWAVPFATLLAHLAYYTILIGGDHFEYRVYSHLAPLLPLALIWSLSRLRVRVLPAISMVGAFALAAAVFPWTQWMLARDRLSREETHELHIPLAPFFPEPLKSYAALLDEHRSWLVDHYVGLRHQEHKVFCEMMLTHYAPSLREHAALLPAMKNPVLVARSVGVAGWTLPEFHVIDTAGLNDYVVARLPTPEGGVRLMAHERLAPPQYWLGFDPTLIFLERVEIRPRPHPLTDARIRELEARYRAALPEPRRDP
ncbi:MAG: hypothetical protein OXT09_35765 [Myxococcales bacterium]|nr:hypothetical protein [Myxococcales bacterium]